MKLPRALEHAAIAALALSAFFTPRLVGQETTSASLAVTSPLDGVIFPRDFAPPVFQWKDPSLATRWRITLQAESVMFTGEAERPEWRPSADQWERIKQQSLSRAARFVVTSPDGASAQVTFQASPDPVGAAIFFREVPLPVGFAMDNKHLIRWKVGDVSSSQPPRTVLTGMKTCANCHSFSKDGKTLALDVDFGSDKSTYAIGSVGKDVTIGRDQLIAWNDYRRGDGEPTLGFLSSLSPDARWVVSTVKETIVLHFLPDPFMSQIFFPVRGTLVAYDREHRTFKAVGGADDPEFVQTNPAFSPDGRWLVFARAKAPDLPRAGTAIHPDYLQAIASDYEEGRRSIQYDLYRVPFNDGRGGTPEPIRGASGNGQSNFFPRFSPDGKWLVFCQAGSMMLNRPDSALYIVPSAGGTAHRLRCNAPGRMNSWHSFSPNGRWLVYASKATGPFTQLWLTHIDDRGDDTTPVLLEGFVAPDRAANLPEFVPLAPGQLQTIQIAAEIRNTTSGIPRPLP